MGAGVDVYYTKPLLYPTMHFLYFLHYIPIALLSSMHISTQKEQTVFTLKQTHWAICTDKGIGRNAHQ